MLDQRKAPSEGAPRDDNALIVRHFPEPDTCAGRLLVELLQGREVTHRTFDGTAHTMRTAVYIRRLRVWGWPIATEMRDGRNAFEPVRYAAYRLVGVEIGPREEMYIATAKRNAPQGASDISGVGEH